MSVNSILNLMRELDLRGALAAFERFVSSPSRLDAMPAQLLLETLLQNEVNNRINSQAAEIYLECHICLMSFLPRILRMTASAVKSSKPSCCL